MQLLIRSFSSFGFTSVCFFFVFVGGLSFLSSSELILSLLLILLMFGCFYAV